MFKNNKTIYVIGMVVPWILIGVAYFYFQLKLGLAPCPLCMFQRAALAGMSIVCLVAFFLSFRANPSIALHKISSGIITILAVIGVSIAGRQVWLQSLPPDEVPSCGVDPVYQWLQSSDYGFMEMLATTLQGSGDCSVSHWSLLGLSIAGWMLVIFSSIVSVAVLSFLRSR